MGEREGKGGKVMDTSRAADLDRGGWYGGERNIAVCFCVAAHPGV